MSSATLVKAIKKAAHNPDAEMVYRWSGGSRVKVDAATAMAEFRAIYEQQNAITPEAVVGRAIDVANPLHEEFLWNDAEAGRQHRDNQARYLMRHLVVSVRKPDNTLTNPIRAIVKVVPDADEELPDVDEDRLYEPRVYVPVARVMSDEDAQRIYLRRALRDLQVWRQRYKNLTAFAHLFDQIDVLEQEIG